MERKDVIFSAMSSRRPHRLFYLNAFLMFQEKYRDPPQMAGTMNLRDPPDRTIRGKGQLDPGYQNSGVLSHI